MIVTCKKVDTASPIFLAGLLRGITHRDCEYFDFSDWLRLGGPQELVQRVYRGTRLYKDEEIQAVSNLDRGTSYLDDGYGQIEFKGEVRVFPSGAAQFKFKRSWNRTVWLDPHEIVNLKYRDGSSIVSG